MQEGEGGRQGPTGHSPLGLPSPLVSHRSSNLWFFPTQEGQHPGLLAVVLSRGPGPPPLALTPQNPETSSQVYKQFLREERLHRQQGSGEGPCPLEPPAGGALTTPLEESFHYPKCKQHSQQATQAQSTRREQGVGMTKAPRVPSILPLIAWVGWAGRLCVGEQTGGHSTSCLTYHLPAEGRSPVPPQPREQATVLLWAPAGGRVVAKAGRVWAGGALLSWGWGWGRRKEESGGGGPWAPVPLEAPGPTKVKQASVPLLLQWRQRRLREAWPQGPQGPRAAEQVRVC